MNITEQIICVTCRYARMYTRRGFHLTAGAIWRELTEILRTNTYLPPAGA